ncbi:MAG: zinc ribbon domain-containing protein [Deltaproteobacteria bacterium]|nr:zinc ribbon domain-containing protein [Deltaproteobacteria bacterium]
MYCSGCGTKVAQDARFCHACGKPLSDTTASGPTMPPEKVADLTVVV